MKKIIQLLISVLLISGCQNAPKKEKVQEPKKDDTVSFVAVGDNLMHQRLLDEAKADDDYDFSSYYTNIKPYIEQADLAFVNQETILGGGKASGYPYFNTPDAMAKNLHDVGFDIVNGSTNHALDQGYEGIQHSIQVFKNYQDMHYIGLYQSQEERDQIQVVEKDGLRIAFLAYNQMLNYTEDYPSYCINDFDEEKMKNDVENAKEISDIVIVSCHWGIENDMEPQPFQKKNAKFLADLGVDIVLGTHTHTLQPVEWIEGQDGHQTLVAYSLGNFISGMLEEDSQLGGMLTCDFKKDGSEWSIQNVTLVPLMNHYETTNQKNIIDTREKFTVYRLKDYTDELAKKHALQGYNGITISKERMQEKVKERVGSHIQIDM